VQQGILLVRNQDSNMDTLRTKRIQEPLSVEITTFLDGVAGTQNSVNPLVSSIEATRVTKVAESAILSSNTGSPIYLDFKGK
jgi:UDP-N-acetylglucosamine 3-dehydrogenase